MKDQDVYTTGEIAKMAGVTTRTIRYYDNKGILSPSSHNSSGHRLYTESDFIKTQKNFSFKVSRIILRRSLKILNLKVLKKKI